MALSRPGDGFDGAAASLLSRSGTYPGHGGESQDGGVHGGRADSCYWVTVVLAVNGFVDRACVLASADFMISPARAGTQTHMDLSEALFCDA